MSDYSHQQQLPPGHFHLREDGPQPLMSPSTTTALLLSHSPSSSPASSSSSASLAPQPSTSPLPRTSSFRASPWPSMGAPSAWPPSLSKSVDHSTARPLHPSSSLPSLLRSSQRLPPPCRGAHWLSFSCVFVLLLVLLIVLSSVLVWWVSYRQSQRTVAQLTSTFRNDLLQHVSDQLTATFNQPLHVTCYLARSFAQDIFVHNSSAVPYAATGFTAELELLLSLFPNLQSLGVISSLQYNVGMQRNTFAQDQWTVVEGVASPDFHSSTLHYYNFSSPRNATYPANQFSQDYQSHWNTSAALIHQSLLSLVSTAAAPVDLSTRPIWARGEQLPVDTVGWTRPYRLAALQAANIGFAAVRQVELVDDGTSPGVVYATTFLTTVDSILAGIYPGSNGVTVIVQASGYLISSSNAVWTLATLSPVLGEDLVPLLGSPDPFLSAIGSALATASLIGPYAYNLTGPIPDFCLSPVAATSLRDLPLTVSGSSYHLQAQSLCALRLDWVIAVLTADRDYTDNIEHSNELTGIIVAVVAVSSILVGALLALAIHRPLHRVIRAMNQLSNGNLLSYDHPPNDDHDPSTLPSPGSTPATKGWREMCSAVGGRVPTLWEVRLLQESFASMLAALRQSSAENRAANDAKRRFFRYIFHEVRVPLNAVALSVQQMSHILDSNGAAPLSSPTPSSPLSAPAPPFPSPPLSPHAGGVSEEVRELLEVMAEQSQVMVRILNDVLSLQKIEEGAAEWKAEPFSLTDLLDGLHRSSALALERKGIAFRISVNGQRWEPRHRIPGALSPPQPPLPDPTAPSAMPPYSITSDIYRLRQIISNFLSNSIKFTPEGGSIEFLLHLPPLPASLPPSASAGPVLPTDLLPVRFSVKDSGPGLTDEEQRRLFLPYTQLTEGSTDRQNVGSGLGLSICRTLVTQQGGTIGVDSVKGCGSTFWFQLPLLVQRAPAQAEASPQAQSSPISTTSSLASQATASPSAALDVSMMELSPTPRLSHSGHVASLSSPPHSPLSPLPPRAGERLRVLVVEDQTASLKLMAAALRSLGCDVLLARDGVECLAQFNIHAPASVDGSPPPQGWEGGGGEKGLAALWALPPEGLQVPCCCDLVLMDNFMPRMSGVQTVRTMRALGVAVPIIGCTGNAMREDIAEFEEAGATSVLSKPVSRAALSGLVQHYTRSRAQSAERAV